VCEGHHLKFKVTGLKGVNPTASLLEREREKVYSPQYNNTAVETVSNNTKWRAARKAQGPS